MLEKEILKRQKKQQKRFLKKTKKNILKEKRK